MGKIIRNYTTYFFRTSDYSIFKYIKTKNKIFCSKYEENQIKYFHFYFKKILGFLFPIIN